jgi:hypothetical protein
MLTDQQVVLIEEKYGKLIHKISNWISGDNMISSHDDNVQDLWLAVMEAVRGYSKKENQVFDEFWGSRGFDKYLKTCLWNLKNNKGAKITKKYPVTKNTHSLHINPQFLLLEDPSSSAVEYNVFFEQFVDLLEPDAQEVIQEVVRDPNYIKPSGKINVSLLSRKLKKTWEETDAILTKIGARLENEL